VHGSKGVAKPSRLSDEDWMKCCEWAKDGIETASFTGNDVQRLMADQQKERMFPVSLHCLYDSNL
jgi:hypothetical protein